MAVIVALPSEEDQVNKYSSEKKAHMTLLYLGEGDSLNQEDVIQYIQHVAKTSLSTFGMTVKRRGPLGPNDADVLFFDDWNDKDLVAARSFLLANDKIKSAHDSAEQFEGWTPHLTMGFPESPAKKDDREYPGFHYVGFDRIAIWFDDYDGPEFVLESDFHKSMDTSPSAAWSDESDKEEIQHAERTVQDVMDDMLDEEREVFDFFVGAAIDDVDLSDDDEAIVGYDLMSEDEKKVLAFVIGGVTADDYSDELKQSIMLDIAEDILEHSGVKGMKWGVRNDKDSTGKPKSSSLPNTAVTRATARAKVASGNATIGDAHRAALKSKGHRVANAFLGDKTFWKRTAIATAANLAVTAAFVGLIASPAAVPMGVLYATAVTINAAKLAVGTALVADNTVRAVRGNARINKSYAAVGDKTNQLVKNGDDKLKKMLKTNGGLKGKFLKDPKSTVKHSDLEDLIGDILGPKALEHFDVENDVVGALDRFENILEHSGVKGMRWGYRRKVGPDGLVKGGVPKEPTDGGPGGSTATPKGGSADHERAIAALEKEKRQGVEFLSNQEIKDINTRIKSLDEFRKNLDPQGKTDLQKRVDELKLNQELRNLEAADRAARQSAGSKLVKGIVATGSKTILESAAKELGIFSRGYIDEMVGNSRKEMAKKSAEETRAKIEKDREEIRKVMRDEAQARRADAREAQKRSQMEYERRQRMAYDDARDRAKNPQNYARKGEKQADGSFLL